MKLLSFILFVCSAITASAFTLAWDANPASDQVTAYNIYEDAIATPIGSVTPPATTFLLPTLTAGPHTFYVTAVNLQGESPHSNAVTLPALPGAPTNLRISP